MTVRLNNWKKNSNYYYHYTSIDNARQILDDKVIRAKKPKVKQFPKAVYFTALCPHSKDKELIKNNYIYYNNDFRKKLDVHLQ